MNSDEFRPLGGHWVRVEGDLVMLRVKGVISQNDMIEFMRFQAKIRREQGWVFMLYDSRENTGLDPAARKYATDYASSESRVDAAASFGAPFSMRVLVNMLNRASVLLGKKGTPVNLFETEAEARRFLESERQRLRPPVAA